LLMAPPSQELEPPANPGRFTFAHVITPRAYAHGTVEDEAVKPLQRREILRTRL
jgi:hypothetical protein